MMPLSQQLTMLQSLLQEDHQQKTYSGTNPEKLLLHNTQSLQSYYYGPVSAQRTEKQCQQEWHSAKPYKSRLKETPSLTLSKKKKEKNWAFKSQITPRSRRAEEEMWRKLAWSNNEQGRESWNHRFCSFHGEREINVRPDYKPNTDVHSWRSLETSTTPLSSLHLQLLHHLFTISF